MAITRAALLTPVEGPEVSGTVVDASGSKKLVGGRPWVYVDRVSQPTMTVYSPVRSNTGAAVVVFPGGGYNVLAIDLEGTEVCDWLTSKGITCVLLKYRVPCVKSGRIGIVERRSKTRREPWDWCASRPHSGVSTRIR